MNDILAGVLIVIGVGMLVFNWPVSRTVTLAAGHKVTIQELFNSPAIRVTVEDPDMEKHTAIFPTNYISRKRLINEMSLRTFASLANKVTNDPSCLFTTVPKLTPGKAIVVTGSFAVNKALLVEVLTRGGPKPKILKAGVNAFKESAAIHDDTVVIVDFVPTEEACRVVREWLAKDECPALIIVMLGMHTNFNFDAEAIAS